MKRSIVIALLGIIVFVGILLVSRERTLRAQVNALQAANESLVKDHATLEFLSLFIEKVLRAEGEVDFETRLTLESAVRALSDPEITVAWEEFTASATEAQAQREVKDLLALLVRKAGR